MKITSLSIENFRNFSTEKFTFDNKIFITGDNGSGKSSVLEAINYFSGFRSFRDYKDNNLIKKDKPHFMIRFEGIREDSPISGGIKYSSKGKEAVFNKTPVNRISDIFGVFLSVIYSGFDKLLATKPPLYRRRFIDRILSITDREYFESLMSYHSILKKRNYMLKNDYNRDLSDTYAMQMSKYAENIYMKRLEFIEYFSSVLNETINMIYDEEKTIAVEYISSKDKGKFNEISLYKILKGMEQKEMRRGRTLAGVHLDDYDIKIDSNKITELGSDGERRLLGMAFKLTETELIYESMGEYPIILLDDITAEIDENKKERMIKLFDSFEQVIISSPLESENTLNYHTIELKCDENESTAN